MAAEVPALAAPADDVPAELEHIIGFSSKFTNTCVPHPTDADKIVYNMASLVVISDLADPYACVLHCILSPCIT